jgi:two-component system, chemotaxis family, protein-glutamate methylesterase/glutaminase
MATAHPLPHPPQRPRVLIVDDSAVARSVLTRIIERDGRFAVVSAVADVGAALEALRVSHVDVVLLDLEMPRVHGLAALPDLLAASRGARVLVVSSACEDGASATIEALARGAADTLVKPGSGAPFGHFAEALTSRLARLSEATDGAADARPAPVAGIAPFDVVAVGASTGGIHALAGMLGALDAGMAAPILVTQHLPLAFSQHFAAQVAVFARRPCAIARDGDALQEGTVLVAPGDAHVLCTRVRGKVMIRLSREPQANGCLPSVDPMFASAADVFGARALGVVLSGMGRDGAIGARAIRAHGGTVIVQDQASSVVWGMPKAVHAAGDADLVLPPEAIGAALMSKWKVA